MSEHVAVTFMFWLLASYMIPVSVPWLALEQTRLENKYKNSIYATALHNLYAGLWNSLDYP